MSLLMRVLRYELKLSVGVVLAIVAIVTVVTVAWRSAPWWVGVLVGFAVVLAEKRWLRRKAPTS